MNGFSATTSGTFLAFLSRSFLTRATSLAGGGVWGMNSPLRGIGCVGHVFCCAFCGTGFSSMP